MKIKIERINQILATVGNSWMGASRHHALKELENLLDRQHEIEKEAEGIEDVFLREYIQEQIDLITTARRSMANDVRWDIESNKKSPDMQ